VIRFRAPESARPEDCASAWTYLGKDARARAALEARLGRPARPLGSRLHDQARRLRRPFLALVARLGAQRTDPEAWWAGTLAWKDPGASDLFLLCCFRAAAFALAADPEEGRTTVVIEDPWLLHELSGALDGRAFFDAPPSLTPAKARALFFGGARRLLWAGRMISSRARLALHGARRAAPPPGAVAVHSYVLERGFAAAGAWTDHYLPGLAEELEAAGRTVVRFTDPDASGFERGLASLGGVSPLILDASWRGFRRALFARPPALGAKAVLDGEDVSLLFERERWADVSRAGRCAFVFFRDSAARFLARTRCSAVVYPWENQPQERMLALAAAEAGARTVGVQHSTIPSLQLSYFSGDGEISWAPLPEVLIVSGEKPLRDLVADGWPRERLVQGGSRRFAPPSSSPLPAADAPASNVLLLLPIDRVQARHLLAAAARVAAGAGFRFFVKCHPADPIPVEQWGFAAEAAPVSMTAALALCGLVAFTGSTAGLEAMLSGRAVLRYRPDSALDVDPCDALGDRELPTAGDGDFQAALERLRIGRPPSEAALRLLPALFGPVDRAAWTAALATNDAE
jgi:hypothetical protein